jgi:ribose/xylose/arabinose/galactoside ABC-type transport system permease subunit
VTAPAREGRRLGLARRALDRAGATVLSRSPLEWLNALGPLLVLVAVYGFFVALAPSTFSSFSNLETMARQTAVIGTAALGMTVIMISGGIDLSVGSVIALSSVVVAVLLKDWRLSPLLAGLGGVAVGAGSGAVSGAVITRFRVLPFIVTLGMMSVLRGVAKWWAGQTTVYPPSTWLDGLLGALPEGRLWLIVPAGVWVMVLLAVAVFVLLRYTRLGRHVHAIGSNERTALLCGVAVERTKVLVYATGGAFAGLAGVMQYSRLTGGDPTTATGAELEVIAAVVIGGGSLSGGEGSVLGSLVGAFLMTVIRSGCSHKGWPNFVQEIVAGLIIVAAVALDRYRRRRTVT